MAGGIVLGLDVGQTNWPGLALMLVVTAIALMPIGIGLAALVIIFKRGEILAAITTFGLGLVSGALFPITELPGLLGSVGRGMPTRFALDGVRKALFTGAGYGSDASILMVFGVIGLPLTVFLMSRSLDRARRKGTLAQY
jgi:ABC-2 type transport system permease protein